jgi:uncharacterized protein YkuJ
MVRRPCTSRKIGLARILKAIEAAGNKTRRVEYDKDGKFVIVIAHDDDDETTNSWDVELDK